MVELNEEFRKLNNLMYETFGDRIPLRQIPQSVTNEEISEAVRQSVAEGRNLLPSLFGYGTHRENRRY